LNFWDIGKEMVNEINLKIGTIKGKMESKDSKGKPCLNHDHRELINHKGRREGAKSTNIFPLLTSDVEH